MHLYLSSYLVGDQGDNLAHLARGKTALVVSNKIDFSNDSERLRSGMVREIGRLADLEIPADPRRPPDSLDRRTPPRKTLVISRIYAIPLKTVTPDITQGGPTNKYVGQK